ncbi:MAG: hypothetical protein ABSG76_24460 [Xanthobacteraceae bacterium]|jgi:hypothetical protein
MNADVDIAAYAHPRRRFRLLRRGPLEAIASGVIAAGVIMLMQPFSLTLYGWSFATTLAGTLLFTVAGRFAE